MPVTLVLTRAVNSDLCLFLENLIAGLRSLTQWSPTFLAPGTSFLEYSFSTDLGRGDGFRMIQVRYIYCVLYLYHYYIISTSDCQALNTRGWGPLLAYCFPLVTNQYLRW